MTYAEIADGIHAHLKRFEKDPKINSKLRGKYGHLPYWNAACWCPGPRSIRVTYCSWFGSEPLKRHNAEAYLAWLDAGNVGKYEDMEWADE